MLKSIGSFGLYKSIFAVSLIVIILGNSISTYAQSCSEWAPWTPCDSACIRERHRTGSSCTSLSESETCSSCTTSTSTVGPQCGEWTSWTDCDASCFKERHKEFCGYAIETQSCGSDCTPSSGSLCGEWTDWECDDDTCDEMRTRRCSSKYERETKKCEDCTPKAQQSSEASTSSESESTEKSEETGSSSTAAIAGGIGGAVLLAASGASTYFYRKGKEFSDEIEISYNPEDEAHDLEPEEAFVYVERGEEAAAVEQTDWAATGLDY